MGASSRRQFVGRASALAAAATVGSVGQAGRVDLRGRPEPRSPAWEACFRPPAGPRYRVISDNDYSGDPDGLFQLVHALLSPSLDVRAVIGSHLAVGDGFDPSTQQAANAVRRAGRCST